MNECHWDRFFFFLLSSSWVTHHTSHIQKVYYIKCLRKELKSEYIGPRLEKRKEEKLLERTLINRTKSHFPPSLTLFYFVQIQSWGYYYYDYDEQSRKHHISPGFSGSTRNKSIKYMLLQIVCESSPLIFLCKSKLTRRISKKYVFAHSLFSSFFSRFSREFTITKALHG